jgi:hypothetical protein
MPSIPAIRAANAASGIRSDQRIRLTGKHTRNSYPETIRRIHLCAPETGRELVLLTNNFLLPEVAQLVKTTNPEI